jgi:16S rRNA (guanine527-N7)-methyltransferase
MTGPALPRLRAGAERLGLSLSDAQVDLLRRYGERLLEHNRRVNVTGAADMAELEVRHLLDSLTVVPHLPEGTASLIDVGSGGGLPGIPLAIVRPEIAVTLLDSVGKKADVMEAIARELGLANVAVVNQRAELAGQMWDYRQRFQVAVARAVADLPVLLEFTLPFVRQLGRAIYFKKGDVAAEVARSRRALRSLGGELVAVTPPPLPDLLPGHQLIIVEKIAPSKAPYPRRPGIPERRPLV